MVGKKGKARFATIALCGALAVSGVAALVVPAVALGECSCAIEVHGSNCPLSRCACDGATTGAHTDGCPLAEVNDDLAACVCEPATHAEGCPRYKGEGELLEGAQSAGGGSATADDAVAAGDEASAADDVAIDGESTGGAAANVATPGDGAGAERPDGHDGDASGTSPEEGGAPVDGEPADEADDGIVDGDGAVVGDTTGDDAVGDDSSTELPEPGSPDAPVAEPSEPESDVDDQSQASEDEPEADEAPEADGETDADEAVGLDDEAKDGEPVMEPLETVVPDDLDAVEDGWEYPSGWSGYGEGQMEGNLLAAAASFTLEGELDARVEEIRGVLTNADNARLVDNGGGFGDVLAVFAVLSGQTERYPYGVGLERDEDVELLTSVYWSMTQVTGVSNANGAAVSVRRLTAEEAIDLYEMDEAEAQAVRHLAEQSDMVEKIVDESIFASLDGDEFDEVIELVPDDISADRRSVLLAAVSLTGKVDYFWGGKSLAYGWDDRWGEMRVVSSAGHSSYGTALPLGLDCSGFVSWAFLNAYGADGMIGDGATNQLYHCETVGWEDAVPGDLVFYYDPSTGSANHVGIVLSVGDSGPETVVHCTTGGVKVSDASGFTYVGRPAVYAS